MGCQKILNDPVVAFTQQIPTIFLPASATCISSLMKILISGETLSDDKESLRDVLDLADAIGIKLQNCIVDSSSKKSFEKRKKPESLSFERKNRMLEEKRWECVICFKKYKSKKLMMKHKKRSHGDKLVQDKTSDDRGIKDETTIKQEVGETSQKNNHENSKSKSLNCDSCDKSFKKLL